LHRFARNDFASNQILILKRIDNAKRRSGKKKQEKNWNDEMMGHIKSARKQIL